VACISGSSFLRRLDRSNEQSSPAPQSQRHGGWRLAFGRRWVGRPGEFCTDGVRHFRESRFVFTLGRISGKNAKSERDKPQPLSVRLGHPAYIGNMKRVVILGRGASGKSTLAVSLGEITGLPVIELDKVFWQPGLVARRRDQWVAIQERLAAEERWIMDGDLGPYDAVEIRLRAADTILFLDFSFLRCAWRAIWRSRERADFWWWLLTYHWRGRPILMEAIANHAVDADLHVFRDPEALRRFVAEVAANRGVKARTDSS